MSLCSVATCQNTRKKTKGKDIAYHVFPKESKLRAIWINYTKRADKHFNPNNARICSEHFIAEDFERDMRHEMGINARRRLQLKTGARPSNNLHGSGRSSSFHAMFETA